FLDLARIDVLAAADDHVLDPADDIAIALGIDGGEVAGMHPAPGIDGLAGARLVVPIAAHHRIAPGQKLARHAGRDDPAVAVDDLDLEMRLDAPDRRDPALDRVVDRALEADRAGLRHAIGDGDLAHMHLLGAALHHLDRAGAAGHDPGAQAGQV